MVEPGTTGNLEGAREALRRHDWPAARELLRGAMEAEPADGDALDLLAEAAWGMGAVEECIAARERAHAAHQSSADMDKAGNDAVWLAIHHVFLARYAISGGWLARARRELEPDPGCVAYGRLLMVEALMQIFAGDHTKARATAEQALALGRDLESDDLQAFALQCLGNLLIDHGDVAGGLATFDEAMVLILQGGISIFVSGLTFCGLLSTCDALGDLRRAAEWTDATDRWNADHPTVYFPGVCQVHRAGVLRWRGAWEQAEREAVRACSALRHFDVFAAASGFDEIGEIRRRLGDLAGAEQAFRQAEELVGQPRSGLALVRLAQGRLDAARAIATRALAETVAPLERAKLLPAQVQIALAAGDVDAARAAVEEFEATAEVFAGAALLAGACLARGRLQLAEGDAASAFPTLHSALQQWQRADVPHEAAIAQVLLAQACRAAGDEDGARTSFAAAIATFARLGAVPDARRARELEVPAALPGGLSEREAEVLRLVAAGMTNKQIDEQLFLSAKTVARHLSNIFTKIGVSSRAAATAYAFEQGVTGSRTSRWREARAGGRGQRWGGPHPTLALTRRVIRFTDERLRKGQPPPGVVASAVAQPAVRPVGGSRRAPRGRPGDGRDQQLGSTLRAPAFATPRTAGMLADAARVAPRGGPSRRRCDRGRRRTAEGPGRQP